METIENALIETTIDKINTGFEEWKLSEWLNKNIIMPFANLISKYPIIIVAVLISALLITIYIKRKK